MIAKPEEKRQQLEREFDFIRHDLIGRKKPIDAASKMRKLAETVLGWLCVENGIPNPPTKFQDRLNRLVQRKAFQPVEMQHQFEIVQKVGNLSVHDAPEPTVDSVLRAFQSLREIRNWFLANYLGIVPRRVLRTLSGLERGLFLGRTLQIEGIHRFLEVGVRQVVVHGPTGVGKTELVRQYADMFRNEYEGGIIELDARSERRIEEQVRQIYMRKVSEIDPVRSASHPPAPAEAVQVYWEHWTPGRSLIIFDDVPSAKERAAEIKNCFPRSESAFCQFDVLVTSQVAWSIKEGSLPLAELSLDASLGLFKAFLTEERVLREEKTAKKVCQWLGGLPIALELVARHMMGTTKTFSEILERFERRGVRDGALDYTHEINASRGWRESFGMVWESLGLQQRVLLHLVSCLPAGPAPSRVIDRTISDAKSREVVLEFSNARDDLLRGHLLKPSETDSALQVHDLVRRAIRLITNLEEDSGGNKVFPQPDLETWNDARDLRRSLANILKTQAEAFLINRQTDRLEEFQDYAGPWSEAVDSHGLIESPAEAVTVLEAAFVYWRDLGAFSDLLRLTEKKELSLGYLREQVPERAFAINERILHGRTDALRETRQYLESRALAEQHKKTSEFDDRKLARALLELAETDRLEGHYNASLRSYQEAESIAESLAEATGDDQKLRAEARYGTARILRLTGRHEASLQAYKEAKGFFEQIPDADPADLARAELGLGEIYRLMWKLDASREHYSNALACKSWNRALVAEWGFGEWERLEGNLENAKDRYEKSRQLSEKVGDIRGISWALIGIGTIELALGKFKEALSSFDDADQMTTEIVEKAHLRFCSAIAKRKAGTATATDFANCLETYEAREMNYCVIQVLINLTLLREKADRAECEELRRARNLARAFGYAREAEVLEECKRGEDQYVINLP